MLIDLKSESAAQRYLLGGLGLLCASILLVVSMAMNYRFGYSLGKTPTDGQIYGAASVAADGFKALSPFFFFAAWRARVWAVAFAAATVWIVMTGYALTGAFGHSLTNRMETASKRTLATEEHADLRADLKRNQDQLGWVPPHRPAATVKADLEGVKGQHLWNKTSECSEVAGKSQRDFCQRYHTLVAELGNADNAVKLNDKIDAINEKLRGTKAGDVLGDADPQAGTIARVMSWNLSSVQFGFALLVVALIEFGSGFGPYVSLAYLFAFGKQVGPTDVIDAEVSEIAPQLDPEQAAIEHLPAAEPLMLAQPSAEAAIEGTAGDAEPAEAPEPPAPLVRMVLPGAEASLADIGFPAAAPSGPKKDSLPAKIAANRFVVWLQAFDLVGQPLNDEDLTRLYAEFCEADWCNPTYAKHLRSELAEHRAVTWRKASVGKGDDGKVKKRARYEIRAGKFPKQPKAPPPPAEPEKPQPKQEGGRLFAFPRPLEEPAREDVPAETTGAGERVDEIAKRRHVPRFDHPAFNAARAHWMRRDGRHMNRKQRGARRRAA